MDQNDRFIQLWLFLTAIMLFPSRGIAESNLPLDKINLPPGFQISVYAQMENPRSMTLSPQGTLFVGSRKAGKVYAIPNANDVQSPKNVHVIDSGLNMPNGVAYKNGSLYVAEVSRILRYDKIEEKLSKPPKAIVLRDDYPTDPHHGWKFIAFGPDEKLYVPVGAPCNVCEKDNPIYSSITRLNIDGSKREIFAHGVRNTVGFDWHPETQELWFTDNGRDWLGDNLPPDELNHAPKIGLHFGFPYCYGKNIEDPKFGDGTCSSRQPPAKELGPHVAALGMRFYTGTLFPSDYHGNIFIAEHGSWNRSSKIGYRIMRIKLNKNRVYSSEEFAGGWLENGSVWGRPVDVQTLPDGSLLISDDYADVIYRITYSK